MVGLLYKELVLNKRTILTIIAGIIFMSIFIFVPLTDLTNGGGQGIEMGVYTFLMSLICLILISLTGTLQQSIFSTDEKKVWANFISSTPLSVYGQVLTKYLFSLLITASLLVYCAIAFKINAVIQGNDCGAIKIIVALSVVQLLLRSIEFPFLIRFGSKSGNSIRMFFSFLLVFIAFIYCLFGDLSIFGTFDDFMKWFTKLMDSETIISIKRTISILAPIIVAVLYFLSYKISCKLYLKGTESYDK